MKRSELENVLLSLVVPAYNEQEVIETTHAEILSSLGAKEGLALEIIYINDGSRDSTFSILEKLASSDERVKVLDFSRNFGHQPAVTAGLSFATGDAVAVLDADLQDPPSVVLEMLEAWKNGADVVYGVRTKRKESLFKRSAYAAFYRMWRSMSDIEVPLDSGDFCLMDREVVAAINSLPERNRFVRGLRSWVGFKQVGVVYERAERAAGETKYPLTKLIRLATDGIFDFSFFPLRLVSTLGIVTFLVAILFGILLILQRLMSLEVFGYTPQDVPGYTSIAVGLLMLSGVQLLSLGVIGEYVGRLYLEAKGRPSYMLKRKLNVEEITPHAETSDTPSQ